MSVALVAAPSAIVSFCGSRYGYCATPQPQTTATTAPTASGRARRGGRRGASSTTTPSPQRADRITSGSPWCVRPWYRYSASEWRTTMPATASAPVARPAASARTVK